MTETESRIGLVWNMIVERPQQYHAWMRYCPWFYLTTAQRQLAESVAPTGVLEGKARKSKGGSNAGLS